MKIQNNFIFRILKNIPIVISCFIIYLIIEIITGIFLHDEIRTHLTMQIGGHLYFSIITWILFYVFLFLFFKYSSKSKRINQMLWIYVIFFTPSFVAIGEALESGYYPYLFYIPYGIELFTKITISFQHWLGNWEQMSLSNLLIYSNTIARLELLSIIIITTIYYTIFNYKRDNKQISIHSITQNEKLIKIIIYLITVSCFLIFFWDYYISTDYCNQFQYSCEYYFIRSSQYIYSVTWIVFSLLLLILFKAKITSKLDYSLLLACLVFFTPTLVSIDVEFQNIYYEPNAFIKPYGVQLISKIISGFHLTKLKGYSDLHSLFKYANKNSTAMLELINLFLTPCIYTYIIFLKFKNNMNKKMPATNKR